MGSPTFYRRLWTLNGIGLLVLLLFALIQGAAEGLEYVSGWLRPEHERGLIVGRGERAAQELDVAVQHVMYERPSAIAGTDYYLAEVVAIDRRLPQEVRDAIEQAGDISTQLIGATINVLFFKSDRSEVHRLLDRNGYIARIDAPDGRSGSHRAEHARPFILYQMALEDTNRDSRINNGDRMGYFVSDLNGRSLRRITPDSLDLSEYWFSDDFREIYFEELIRDESRAQSPHVLEERTLYYYNVEQRRFGRFDALQEALTEVAREFRQDPP